MRAWSPATAIASCCTIFKSATAGGPLHAMQGQHDSRGCAAGYTSASRTASTPSPSAPPAQGASAAAATATCTCKEQALGQAAQDVICSSNGG
ncbi:hypothetical protein BC830DRAFT_1150810 [Chytriomyces sp. MP71]|nr:hypothetical protein BC830DRAFT_1150810 [Chytriomyces sp. MP71]